MERNSYRSLRWLAPVVVFGIGLFVAGCGSDDSSEAVSDTVPDAADVEASEQDEAPPALEIVADDYSFAGVPETVPAGTRVVMTNRSSVELHEVVVARVADNETRPIEELIGLGEGLMELIVAPPSVIVAMPESDGFVVAGDGVLAEPGRYLFVCFIPVGADPAAYAAAAEESDGPPQGFDGPPHAARGMFADVTVTP